MAIPFDAAAARKQEGMSTAFLYKSKPDAHVSHPEPVSNVVSTRATIPTRGELPVARPATHYPAKHDARTVPTMYDAVPKRRQPAMSGFSYTSDDDDTILDYLERVKDDERLAKKLERSTRSVQQRIQVLVRKNQRHLDELAEDRVALPPFPEQDELRLYHMLRDGQTLERAGLVLQRSEASMLRRLRKLQETRASGHFVEIDRILAAVDPHLRKYDSYDSASDDGSYGSWPSYDSEPAEPMRMPDRDVDTQRPLSGDAVPPSRSTENHHRRLSSANIDAERSAALVRGSPANSHTPVPASTGQPANPGFSTFLSRVGHLHTEDARAHFAKMQRQIDMLERMDPSLVPESLRTRRLIPSPVSSSATPPLPLHTAGRTGTQPLQQVSNGSRAGSGMATFPHVVGPSIAVVPSPQPPAIRTRPAPAAQMPSPIIAQSTDPRLRPTPATTSTTLPDASTPSPAAICPLIARQPSKSTTTTGTSSPTLQVALRPWSDAHYEKGMAGLKRFLDLVEESSSRKRARTTEA